MCYDCFQPKTDSALIKTIEDAKIRAKKDSYTGNVYVYQKIGEVGYEATTNPIPNRNPYMYLYFDKGVAF